MVARVAPFEKIDPHHYRRFYYEGEASEDDCDDGRNDHFAEFLSGERICQPYHFDRRGTGAAQIYTLVAAIVAVTWSLVANPGNWQGSITQTTLRALNNANLSVAPSVPSPSVSAEIATVPLAPLPATTVIEPTAFTRDAVDVADDAPAAAVDDRSGPGQRITERVIDTNDRYTKMALEAGLSTDLSRAVLERLSDTDYRNAAYAVKTALRGPADAAPLTWPSKARTNDAIFEVKFVQSAGTHCRRYVVTVTKSGWSTTALPIETCSVRAK